MPTACNGPKLSCQSPEGVRQPRIEADFPGGPITSNAGLPQAVAPCSRKTLFEMSMPTVLTFSMDALLLDFPCSLSGGFSGAL